MPTMPTLPTIPVPPPVSSIPPVPTVTPLSQGPPEFCVFLKGLPYEADKTQVKDFFKNLAIVEDSIYIAYGPNGRATGEGFLEFKTEQDYKTALGAHMQYMGTRFIQVHPISRKGMLEKIDTIRKLPRNCAHITNIPYNISKKDVRAFLEGVGLYEDTLKVLTDSQGNGLGQAIFQLRTEEDARKAERLHRQKLNGRDAFVHLVTFEQMKEIERNPPPQNKRGQPDSLRNQPLQNMPFTVTVDEIMDFFYGYQVLPGSVCLQFSEKGLPTGEAMVAFQNHEEATAAVMDLNDRPIGARKVKISLG
uniref:RRM domain-containing protein n=1 Tax=Monopterus albus TaxID=43700 RepID=A0A3Q3REC2_MONAL